MDYYTLYNGVKIPVTGYGTFSQKESLHRNIGLAIEKGYRLIDTSDNYHNEGDVGIGLDNYSDSSIKDSLIIVTKFSTPKLSHDVKKAFSNSKDLLKGKLDIYLMHWPYPFLWKRVYRQMEELYLNGKCAAIGVCNFDEKQLSWLLKNARIKPMINQFECHPDFQQRELIEFCQENDIQVMSYSPLARMDTSLMGNTVIDDIAKRYNKTIGQVILKWNLCNNLLPIPATSNEVHMAENLDIFDFELTKDEVSAIDNLECGNRVRFDPHKRFSLKKKMLFLLYSLRRMKV